MGKYLRHSLACDSSCLSTEGRCRVKIYLRKRNNRPPKPLTEWASADAKPRGPVSFHLNPRKRASIVPHPRPGVRCNPVSCRGYFHARRESGSHRKQSWQAGQEYIHSCKMLVGAGSHPPEKSRHRRPFSSSLRDNCASCGRSQTWGHTFSFSAGQVSPYSAPARARSRSTCEAFGKAA